MALKPARLQWSGDGSPVSLEYDDVYFQRGQGVAESRYVFLRGNGLEERFAKGGVFRIAELGFGTGLNFLLTVDLWKRTAPPGSRLVYASIEKHPVVREDLVRLYASMPEFAEEAGAVLAQYPPLARGFHRIRLPGIDLLLLLGDVAEMLPELEGQFDAWYLDGFTPAKNPDMWEDTLYPLIAARTASGGTLATFSVAGHMRRGLAATGFAVEKVKGFGVKWSMTEARFPGAPREQKRMPHVTVLGAGMAGCAAANALARKGCTVTVIDKQPSFAQEASGNPFGVLYPKLTVDDSPMGNYHLHGFCFTRALLESLRLPSWRPCGVVRLDLDEDSAARSRALIDRNGYPDDLVRLVEDAGAIAGIDAPHPALFHETAGYLSPPDLCRALLDHPGIETGFGRAVEELPEGLVVVALGNASTAFPATAWLPLHSLRGQVSLCAETEQSRRLRTVVCHDGFVMPAENGLHVAGATFQKEDQTEAQTRDEDHAENMEKLARNLPGLGAGAVTGGRAGYRATTPDKLPLVGLCPDHDAFMETGQGMHEDVYVATGFGAHGLSGAPLAGEMVASLIAGDPLPVPLSLASYLAPERFLLRARKRAGT